MSSIVDYVGYAVTTPTHLYYFVTEEILIHRKYARRLFNASSDFRGGVTWGMQYLHHQILR